MVNVGKYTSPMDPMGNESLSMTANSDQDFFEEDVWEAATQRAVAAQRVSIYHGNLGGPTFPQMLSATNK